MSNNTVDANWTLNNERRIAKKESMLVNGIISDAALANLIKEYPIDNPVQDKPSEAGAFVPGHCYCGRVKLELPSTIKPAISVICHCHDCREWHSVGRLPYMMFPLRTEATKDGNKYYIPIKVSFTESFRSSVGSNRSMLRKVVSSPELLAFVHRTPEVRRFYAQCCGTRLFNAVFNEKLGLKLCGTFPTVFPGYDWVPTMHVNVREGNDLHYPSLNGDNWADLPSAFGGTGRQITSAS